jgi:hypothetical protein
MAAQAGEAAAPLAARNADPHTQSSKLASPSGFSK